ncbi:chorion class B protein PC10-like [Leguminivora glycinivorella]|uniref:chorion class B protein PC10-like n=1 Tax=Leguminivora glycinivorella TaxID=1035111 RepID=UPI00200BAEF1|nr:chorion class B protein PC10-like [Leguminivora glycinivorella]XP_048002272.1 chorion class B protein PC10-like [Leguminivora glycinivorella]
MSFKAVIFCAAAFLVQSIAAQRNCGCSCQSIEISNNGGALLVTSAGPIAPSGIAVATELGLSGELDLSGALPYLSAVAFEGQFPTSGSAPVCYGCGDNVAITQEIGGSGGCGCVRR